MNIYKRINSSLKRSIKNRKKGFTLLEMVLIVAIIGVLSAIIVPMTGDNNDVDEAYSRARGFYYNLQGVMTDYLSDYYRDDTNPNVLPRQTYYLHIVASKGYTNPASLTHVVSYELATDSDFNAASLIAHGSPGVDVDSGDVLTDRLRHTVLEMDKDSHLYAEIDDKFRVTKVYWSVEPLSAGDLITSSAKVDGATIGIFPFVDLSSGTVTVFDV